MGAEAGVTENRAGRKLLFKKNSEEKRVVDTDPYGSVSFGQIRVAPKTNRNHAIKNQYCPKIFGIYSKYSLYES